MHVLAAERRGGPVKDVIEALADAGASQVVDPGVYVPGIGRRVASDPQDCDLFIDSHELEVDLGGSWVGLVPAVGHASVLGQELDDQAVWRAVEVAKLNCCVRVCCCVLFSFLITIG